MPLVSCRFCCCRAGAIQRAARVCKERFAYVVTEPGEVNDAVVTEAAFADEHPRRLAACPRTGQDGVTGHGNTIDRLSEHCLNAHGHAGSSRAAVGPIAQTTAGDDRASDGMGHYFSAVGKANGAAGSKCHCIIIKAFIAITILIIVADIISPSPSSLPMSPPSSHPSSNHHLIVIIIIIITTII